MVPPTHEAAAAGAPDCSERMGSDVIVYLVTSAAHRKLRDACALVPRIVLD